MYTTTDGLSDDPRFRRGPIKHMGGTPAGPLSLQKCSGKTSAVCPNGITNVGAYPGQYFAVDGDQVAAGAFMGLSLLAWAVIGLGGYYGYKWFTKRESKAKRNNRLARYKSNPSSKYSRLSESARKAARTRRIRQVLHLKDRSSLSHKKKEQNRILREHYTARTTSAGKTIFDRKYK